MQIVHCKGIRQDVGNVVYIGRPSLFSNPFRMQGEATRLDTIELYRVLFNRQLINRPWFRQKVLELRGHDLSCWCAPRPCHGDVIIEWLEKNG
jgi:hypothetical protein